MIIHPRLILIDVDGVLLNWIDPFISWAHNTGFMASIGGREVDPHEYDIAIRFGITPEQADLAMRLFNTSIYASRLPPMNGAVKNVANLVKQGYTLHAISAFSNDFLAHEARKQNLVRLYGDSAFTNFTFLDNHASKYDVLSTLLNSHISPSFWIEDNLTNATAGFDLGINTILYDEENIWPLQKTTMIKNGTLMMKIDNWDSMYRHINGE